jgi:ubiquinone/menaquinone biosynthesis methyltransferase
MEDNDLFKADFVRDLFNEMSATYGTTNLVASFGFSHRWRKHCVEQADIQSGMTVYDLMSGMGECWPLINQKLVDKGKLVALDFCPEMCRKAEARKSSIPNLNTTLLQEDFLQNSIPSSSADRIVSSFGIKTFSDDQKAIVAQEIQRILKPDGIFSLLEISIPKNKFLRFLYMLYLKNIIPLIGKLFLGNPENYRLLGIYTEHFQNSSMMGSFLEKVGLDVEHQSLFLGCASNLVGKKPTN